MTSLLIKSFEYLLPHLVISEKFKMRMICQELLHVLSVRHLGLYLDLASRVQSSEYIYQGRGGEDYNVVAATFNCIRETSNLS